jgi:hypothetical protein
MPNFFYTDAIGRKQGPINDQQLKTLVSEGVIKSHTPLETEDGHKGRAGQVRGLFPTPPPSPPVPVPPPVPSHTDEILSQHVDEILSQIDKSQKIEKDREKFFPPTMPEEPALEQSDTSAVPTQKSIQDIKNEVKLLTIVTTTTIAESKAVRIGTTIIISIVSVMLFLFLAALGGFR